MKKIFAVKTFMLVYASSLKSNTRFPYLVMSKNMEDGNEFESKGKVQEIKKAKMLNIQEMYVCMHINN